MEDIEVKHKQEKAKVYATQPERFELLEVKFRMRSRHGVRLVVFADSSWGCSCDFFRERGTCSHIMAAREMLKAFLPERQLSEFEG